MDYGTIIILAIIAIIIVFIINNFWIIISIIAITVIIIIAVYVSKKNSDNNSRNISQNNISENNNLPKNNLSTYNNSDSNSDSPVVSWLKRTEISYSKIKAAPNNYIVFDIETTGLNHIENDILEIGAIKYNNGVENERFHTYIKNDKPIPQFITNLNGISNETIKDAPLIRTALRSFLNFIGDYTLIAFNSDFDMSFMQYNYQKKLNTSINNDVIDALPLAREYLRELPNKKLVTIKQHFGLEVGSHNAIDDCIVTNHLYQYCRQFEELKYKYAVKFSYDPRELSDKEVEYLNTIVNICEKSNINKSQLSMRTSGTLLVIEKNNEQLVSIKLNGKLQYVLLQIPFEKFEEKYPTEIKHTPSSKSEGNYTRLFTTSSEQLWQFESAIIKKSQKNWTTENK